MKKSNASRILDKLKISGVSPLGMKKYYPTYIDESAFRFPSILISAGLRGLQLKLNLDDLFKAIKLTAGKLTVK